MNVFHLPAGDEEADKSSSNYSSARDEKEGELPDMDHDEQDELVDDKNSEEGDQDDKDIDKNGEECDQDGKESVNSLDDDNPSPPENNGRPQREKAEGHKVPSWSGSKPPWASMDGLQYYQAASREACDIGKKLFQKTSSSSTGNPNAWKELAEKMRHAFPIYKSDWQVLRDNLWSGTKKKGGGPRRSSLMDAYRLKFATTHADESGEGEAENEMERNCFKLIELEQSVKRDEDKAKAEADKKATEEKGREADVESAFRNKSGKPKGTPGASAAAGADAPRGQRSKPRPPSRGSSSGGDASTGARPPKKQSKTKSVYDTLIHTKIPMGISVPNEDVMTAIGCLDDYESNLWDLAKGMEKEEMEESDAAELMLKPIWRGLDFVGYQPFHRHEPGYAKNVVGQLGDWAPHHMTYMTWLSTLSREHVTAMSKACGIQQEKRTGGGDGGGGDRDDMASLGNSIAVAAERAADAQKAKIASSERRQSEKLTAAAEARNDEHAHQLKVLALQSEAATLAAAAAAAAQQTMIESLTRKTPAQRLAELEAIKSILSAKEYEDKRASIIASI